MALAVGILMTIGLSVEELDTKPLSGWRRSLRSSLRFIGRAIIFCFGFHRIKKIGKRASKDEASIFVAAPHSSFFDTIIFFVLGLPSGVSKAENASLPIIGRLVRAMQPILVARTDKSNKMKTINEIKRRAAKDSEWPPVLLFPEGTTTNHSCLITFKPGAFIPGLPVQPVAIQYGNRMDTITWTWQGQDAYKACFLTLCQFNNKMSVTVSRQFFFFFF
jgi:lysophosphatidylcholine acyltransferase/lyso-PAF acetyltransferase